LLGLFPIENDLGSLVATLQFHPQVLNRESLQVTALEDQAWERAWMKDFQPRQFGERLWICPSWQPPPDPEAVNIMLDPGMAFGTGTHATTAMCLGWLEQAQLQSKEVIDYGSGSGVLAIGAALLGARQVYAVDNDPQAIAATIDNSHRNNIPQQTITAHLPKTLPKLQSDILLANILAEPLHELADHFAALVKPGGSIVLSGILTEQAGPLSESYGRWFAMSRPEIREGWVLLHGTRKA
jgi:ribosomal protein L11 methyltransferase